MDYRKVKKNNRKARAAFLMMLRSKTKRSKKFWRNVWLVYSYQSVKSFWKGD